MCKTTQEELITHYLGNTTAEERYEQHSYNCGIIASVLVCCNYLRPAAVTPPHSSFSHSPHISSFHILALHETKLLKLVVLTQHLLASRKQP